MYEKRSGTESDSGRRPLTYLLERDEVKSKIMDVPKYVAAKIEDQAAYRDLVREVANELGTFTYTLVELCSGFFMQRRKEIPKTYTSLSQHLLANPSGSYASENVSEKANVNYT